MYTCQVCNYALTIGKITSSMQENIITINDPNEFIKMFVNKKKKNNSTLSGQSTGQQSLDSTMELNFDTNSLDSLIKKNNVKQDVAVLITEKFNTIKKNTRPNTFCLKCSNCNETFILPPGKLLSIKLKKTNTTNNIENIDEIIHDYTLPRTKDYICPNSECKVSDLDKEAIIYRPNPAEFLTQYICVNCQTCF